MASGITPVFHIMVIGSAGFDSCQGVAGSKGQLPTVDNLHYFISCRKRDSTTPDQCYFYFIDPRHLEVKGDLIHIESYEREGICCSVITEAFSWDTFHGKYRIESGDHVLIVDYSNYVESEYEFGSRFGYKENWHYWCPGCAGKQLDVEEAYRKALKIPWYSVEGNKPLVLKSEVSKAYREGIMKELNQLLIYARLLPADVSDERPPEWLAKEIGGDPRIWAEKREEAYRILSTFFVVNGRDYIMKPVGKWYSLVREMVLG